MTTANDNQNKNKITIDVFVPLNTCSCVYESFIQRVFNVLLDYMKLISYQTKSLDSEEARQLGLMENSIVVDGTKIFTSAFDLKKELPKLLKEKNLI